MDDIRGFSGDNRFLSNFWFVNVVFDGKTYRSVEHAYQAAKSLDDENREYLRKVPSPAMVKLYARKMILRPDWEQVKVPVMYGLLVQKFTLYPDLRAKLLATGDAYLEETNHWNDTFWGVCKGVGTNALGECLMRVRNKLKSMPS